MHEVDRLRAEEVRLAAAAAAAGEGGEAEEIKKKERRGSHGVWDFIKRLVSKKRIEEPEKEGKTERARSR